MEELEKFSKTDESKALTAPFQYLLNIFIKNTGEQIDLNKLSHISRGIELMVNTLFF